MRTIGLLLILVIAKAGFAQTKQINFSFPVKAKWREVDGFTSRAYSKQGVLSYSYETNDSIYRLLIDSVGNTIAAVTQPRWYTNYSPSLKEMDKYIDKPNYLFSNEFTTIGGITDGRNEIVFFSSKKVGGIMANILHADANVSEQKVIDRVEEENIISIKNFPDKFQMLAYQKKEKIFLVVTVDSTFQVKKQLIPIGRYEGLKTSKPETMDSENGFTKLIMDKALPLDIRYNDRGEKIDAFFLFKDSLIIKRMDVGSGSSTYHTLLLDSMIENDVDFKKYNLSIIEDGDNYLVSYLDENKFSINLANVKDDSFNRIFQLKSDSVSEVKGLYTVSDDENTFGKTVPFKSFFKNHDIKHLFVKTIHNNGKRYLQVTTTVLTADKQFYKFASVAGLALLPFGFLSEMILLSQNIAVLSSRDGELHSKFPGEINSFVIEKQVTGFTLESDAANIISSNRNDQYVDKPNVKSKFRHVSFLAGKHYVLTQLEKGSNLLLEIL